ncbi:MAG: tyrosine decarboxylase MfnA [Candidatus Bathyarchaeota archaeon]|nr:tyrosine decarboxylase MfnA [Candidatus Bathyarchaeota archaeon]
MQSKGSSRKTVLSELKKMRALDQRYDDGKILCSMCTKPHPIAMKAYQMFQESNLGDSGLFSGSLQLERDVIAQLATLLHCKSAVGFVVSGGTEANLMALLVARNSANVKEPEVVLPQSAHFSFTKICSMLNLKPVYAKLDASFGVAPSEVEKCLSERTVAIVGTAGTAELGVIDPVDKLSEIALRHNVWLHVDAAFGGLVIPFLNKTKPQFDFALDAVESITVDPHKMGMAAIPAGGILFRKAKALDALKVETPYLTDKFQYTFVGTRTGASAASAWAVFKLLGFEGFQKIIKGCMATTKLFADGLKTGGFKLVVEPPLNIIAFQSENTKQTAEQLRRKGWFVSYVPRYDCIRIAVMPHVKRRHVEAFLKCLSELKP